MQINRIRLLVIALVTALICLSGCADIKKLKNVEIAQVKVGQITPHGFRNAVLKLSMEIDNPGAQVAADEIYITLKHSGKVLGMVAVDPFILLGKTTETYSLEADVSLDKGVNILDLGRFIDKKEIDKVVVDVSAVVRIKKGPARKVELTDVPLKKLIESIK